MRGCMEQGNAIGVQRLGLFLSPTCVTLLTTEQVMNTVMQVISGPSTLTRLEKGFSLIPISPKSFTSTS